MENERENLNSWLSEHWRPLLLVAVLGLLPFLPILLAGKILMASDQVGAPAWRFYFDALRRGELPLWNPYGLGGMPTFDAMFGDASYPFFLLLGFLLPVTHAVTFNFVLHALIAGLAAYVLVQRYFRLDRWPAAALAAAYMLNTNFISHIHAGHTGKFHIMAWLPLSLYCLLRALGPEAHGRHLLGLSLTVGLFISTSHLQFTYYVLMGFFLVWLYFLAPALKGRRFGEAGLLALRFWVPILLGIGLAFFIFYPPLEYTREFGIRGSGAKSTFEHAASWSMHPEETASLLVPEFGGLNENYWGRNYFKLNSEYPGLLAWFLGLWGLIAFRKKWFWFWGGVGLLSVIFGLGAHTPFFRLFYEFVPGMKNFRAPSMMLFWLATALMLMGGETLRRLLAAGEEALPDSDRKGLLKKLRIGGFSAAGFLLLCGLAASTVYALWGGDASQMPNLQRQETARSAFTLGAFRSAGLLALLTWAAGAFLLQARRPMAFGLAALAATAADLYWVNSNFISGYEARKYLSQEPAVDLLKADSSRFRVFGLPGAYERWFPQYHGLETADGWTDNEMRQYRELRGNDYQRNPNFMAGLRQNPDGTVQGSAFLDLLNVKYLAFRLPDHPGLRLAVNRSFLPRAFFVPAWEAATDSQALQKMKIPGFDPKTLAYITGPGAGSGGRAPDSGAAPAAVAEKLRKYNRQVYEVEAPGEGLLVISEMWFPHWRVKVDGADAPLWRADFAFRGVLLKPGRHTVEFSYHSPWIRKGLWVTLLSAVGMAGLCLLSVAMERRKG